ncbi:MAG: HAD-IA family hydrolase [Pseudomonadota bacterium]
MTFSAIIFDCDGVLVDSEKIYLSVEREFLDRLGLSFDAVEYSQQFMGLKTADYLAALDKELRRQKGRGLPETFAADFRSEAVRRLKAELQMISGVERLLEHYTGAVAVASSSAVETLRIKMEMTGLHSHFHPHIYSGEQVKNGKPAPDLFLLAAKQICHAPENCLVLEDSVNGVRAGRAAGMTVWGFTGGGHADDGLEARLREAGAHDVLPDFDSVRQRLL